MSNGSTTTTHRSQNYLVHSPKKKVSGFKNTHIQSVTLLSSFELTGRSTSSKH